MNHEHPSSSPLGLGATAVITYCVQDGQQEGYDAWLNEIGPLCRGYPGHLDLQIIRPVPGLTVTYTVIIRFDPRAVHGTVRRRAGQADDPASLCHSATAPEGPAELSGNPYRV
ncbi:MAG: hypothetical protein KC588_13625 [Nitrospira sp.]|nr:hypothetical protein [Nitrospira sp.]